MHTFISCVWWKKNNMCVIVWVVDRNIAFVSWLDQTIVSLIKKLSKFEEKNNNVATTPSGKMARF